MSYTTAARVQALAARLPTFSAATTVTADEVDTFIEDTEAEINVALSKHGYTVPVSSPAEFLTWLGKVATEGVAALVLKAWYQDSTGPNSESAWSMYERRYRDALKEIRDGVMIPGSTDDGGGAGIASFTTDVAVDELGTGGDADAVFTMTTEW